MLENFSKINVTVLGAMFDKITGEIKGESCTGTLTIKDVDTEKIYFCDFVKAMQM